MSEAMPKSVVWYERIAYSGIALSIAYLLFTWSETTRHLKISPVGFLLTLIAVFVLQMLWIWLVARKRQNWARWTSVVFLLIGIPQMIWGFDERYRIDHIAAIAFYSIDLLFFVAVGLLFLPDARIWFRSPQAKTEG